MGCLDGEDWDMAAGAARRDGLERGDGVLARRVRPRRGYVDLPQTMVLGGMGEVFHLSSVVTDEMSLLRSKVACSYTGRD